MTADRDWIQVVAVPTLIASVPGGIAVWQWWVGRSDKQKEAQRVAGQSAVEKRDVAMSSERDALTKDMRALLERTEADRDREAAEVCRLREEKRFVERERDRWLDLARWWARTAHDMRYAAASAQSVADTLAVGRDMPPQEWPDMKLPGFQDPLPPP